MAGSGIQADPWIVTTYDELVTKAAGSGEYVRIGNNINIADEYPNGNMPQLVLRASVDGNGKKVSNWYKTNGVAISVQGPTAQLYDCTIGNMYCTNDKFMELSGNNPDFHFVNCNFHGMLWQEMFMAINDNNSVNNFKSCSFNIKSNTSYAVISSNSYGYIGMQDCYIKVSSTTATELFHTDRSTFIEGCYIESNIPCGAYYTVKNSALDITTNTSFTANGNSGNALSIINVTHAPLAVAGNGFALATDSQWLDVEELSRIGFNAG